ncbi:uncharacterized protein LOC132706492 [Cylas formicarius]|uniref:uncharacterized protein LOC132706492 n=1 Tax=Cylas formicarius TaxID=197179 RepID=UPI002958402F|nr:uncharacterized protein LOC132706492 [Cylas formicarius]
MFRSYQIIPQHTRKMHFGNCFIALSAALLLTECQSQYQSAYAPFPQLDVSSPGFGFPGRFPSMRRHFNPFDNVYNEEGRKLTCRMVCSETAIEKASSSSEEKQS